MKARMHRFISLIACWLLVVPSSRAGVALVGEELAVIQAMASILNHDTARPFDFLYFESDFPAGPYVSSSLSNPDRTSFCGLTREQAQSVARQLIDLTARPVEIDKSVARAAGLSIGHKRLERFRYLTLSRVVFSSDQRQAWIAVDLNGETGALISLEKTGDEWKKVARCGGWLKTD